MATITQVNRGDVFAALARIGDTMGADEANMIQAYIVLLEAQLEYYREKSMSQGERLTFYGVTSEMSLAEDVAP